jgi:hypothetical protein
MNILSRCTKKYESGWVSSNNFWKELGQDAFNDCYEQINNRIKYESAHKVHERGEESLSTLVRSKLVKGLTAEWFVYYMLTSMGYEVNPPRNEGASWDPDLYAKNTMETFEIKCTEGELRANWRKETKNLQGWKLQKYYRCNSPSYAFQIGDRHGNQSQRNTDPIFRKLGNPNAYLVLVRKRKVYHWKGNRKIHVDDEYKISSIVKKNDITLNLDVYFEEFDWDVVNKSKRRLIETNLKGPFYGPNIISSESFQLNEEDFPSLF